MQRRKRYVAHWVRLLLEKEIRARNLSRKVFKLEAEKCSKAYRESGSTSAAIGAAKSLVPTWIATIDAIYSTTIPSFVEFTLTQIAANAKKDSFLEQQRAFIKLQGLAKAKGINETTIKKLQKTISNGIEMGKSQDEIADLIKDALVGVSEWRAQTIARTEVHTAASWAQQETAKRTGSEMAREWCAVEDDRTRDTHREADGQVVGMDEPFIVGDSQLDFPGDPNGPPEETINCRCAVRYVPKSVFEFSEFDDL